MYCMLRGRPFGGVMTLVNKKLRKFTTTIHCDERFVLLLYQICSTQLAASFGTFSALARRRSIALTNGVR